MVLPALGFLSQQKASSIRLSLPFLHRRPQVFMHDFPELTPWVNGTPDIQITVMQSTACHADRRFN
jgi:hypothetical protein